MEMSASVAPTLWPSPLYLNTTLLDASSPPSSSAAQPRPLTTNATLVTSSTTPSSLLADVNVPYMAAELIIAFLSTAGNALVCAAVGLDRRLHTVTNYFLASLAVADALVGALAIPCAILTGMGVPRHNLPLCLLMLSVLITLTQSSIFSLLGVAAERYVAIFMPLRYGATMTARNALLAIAGTWALALVIGLVPLMGWHKPPPASGHCFFVTVVELSYMVYFNFFACVLAPLIAMFLAYARIFAAVRRQLRRVARGDGEGARGDARRELKTATSLFTVLFLFTVCWIPLHVVNCFLLLCPACEVPLPLLLTAIILSHANSAVNPFLYAYKMRSFREAFKGIFLCCRGAGRWQNHPDDRS